MGFGATFLLNYTFLYFSNFLPAPPDHCHSKRKPGVAFWLHLLYRSRPVLLWLIAGADGPEAAQGLRAPQAGGLRGRDSLVSPDELRPSLSLSPAGLASLSGRCSAVVASHCAALGLVSFQLQA